MKWNPLKDSMEGVSGFIARAYEGLEGPDPANNVANCASDLKVLECTIEGLEPSTNYTITVAAFKRLQDDLPTIYGDASIVVHAQTGKAQHIVGRVNHVHFLWLCGSFTERQKV